MQSVRSIVLAVSVTLVIGVTVACSGPRSSLAAGTAGTVPLPGGATGSTTGEPTVDAVLNLLERPLATSFTVEYTIDRKLGAITAGATVAHGPLATSVTVRNVRFLLDDTSPRTCDLTARSCEDTVVDARVSDLGIGARFWRDSPARALRVTAARRSGPPAASTPMVGGQPATCVDVPVGAGVERYCALASGVIARWDTAYVDIEATSTRPTFDQEAFATLTG